MVLPAALLLVLAVAALAWWARPQVVHLSGESEVSTDDFQVLDRRYAVQADLLPECQYTFYLTPQGQVWHRAGKAIASASGEATLTARTDRLTAGRYFVHTFTAPEEGCSWSLRLNPL